ncbi:DUF5980 family protein [Solwaraspora sp. WMMA2065]|uniref:DUF5980 family protein n=1 Tax=Solwaraspora sp. WMMA2065 TaxID=3015166 RepID=UPI00338F5287
MHEGRRTGCVPGSGVGGRPRSHHRRRLIVRLTRSVKVALAVATGLALTLAISPSTASAAVGTGSAAPAAGTSQATWHLSDYEQRVCLPAGESNFTYFVGFVAGSWSSPLHVDMHGLPEGTDYGLPHPIAPGRRSAPAADRLSLPCSAGVPFPPGRNAGVSTEGIR